MNVIIFLFTFVVSMFASGMAVSEGRFIYLGETAPESAVYEKIVLAQAGSIGGQIGRGQRDLSGSKKQATPTKHRKSTGGGGCSGLTGRWSSWAAFLFGKGDVTFTGGGGLVHGSGFTGSWKCSGGRITVKWNHDPTYYQLKKAAGGSTLVDANGRVAFRRAGKAGSKSLPPAKRKNLFLQ